jgi:hypothetical protein
MPIGIDTGSPVRQRPLMASWTANELDREVTGTGYWRTTRAASPAAGLPDGRTTYTSELLAARKCVRAAAAWSAQRSGRQPARC